MASSFLFLPPSNIFIFLQVPIFFLILFLFLHSLSRRDINAFSIFRNKLKGNTTESKKKQKGKRDETQERRKKESPKDCAYVGGWVSAGRGRGEKEGGNGEKGR